MRERLNEIICSQIRDECIRYCNHPYCDRVEDITDYLRAEGVIVPPCKVGQTVYVPWVYNNTKGIACFEVTHIITDRNKSYVRTNFDTDDEGFWEEFNGGCFNFDDFGITIFLTKEEAEKALAERSKR